MKKENTRDPNWLQQNMNHPLPTRRIFNKMLLEPNIIEHQTYIREKENVIEELFDMIIQNLKDQMNHLQKGFERSTWRSC